MRILLSLLLIMISSSVNSTTYAKQSVSKYFDNAEIVARILIQKSELVGSQYKDEEIGCGVKITGKVIESFKGKVETVVFFIEGMALNTGSEYLVFLEGNTSKDIAPLTSTNSIAQTEAYKRYKACAKYRSGFIGNWLNVSKFLKKWSKEEQKMQDWITPAYNVSITEEDGVIGESVEIRALVVNGEVIENEFWSIDDGVVFPDEFWMYDGAYQWNSYRHLLQPSKTRDNKASNPTP